MPVIDFRLIAVDTGSADREGCLALVNDHLVAVLTRLDPGTHGSCGGHWHVEATFSISVRRLPRHSTFADLEQCRAWLAICYG